MKSLITKVIHSAIKAGNEIMSYYGVNIDYVDKGDGSPLTKADLASNQIIKYDLMKIDRNINFLSEEEKYIVWDIRKNWVKYWLVDPLDGTKEFINKNGEFTVNIALIENNLPSMGVIYAPCLNILYYAISNHGAYKHENVNMNNRIEYFNSKNLINCSKSISKLNIVASRSHHSEDLDIWLKKYEKFNLVDAGSSLKFCLVADGTADVYPRFVGSSEWDIAAGFIILKESGGVILDENNKELSFNKRSLRNPNFIASSKNFLLN